ncbi:MAG: CotH kinase family protein [Flavobacteriales bacterium]
MKRNTLFLLFALALAMANAQVSINEVQITNDVTHADEDGDYGDWIEMYNSGAEAINLNGYGLTDDATTPMKWVLPELVLQPNEREVIYASGKDRNLLGGIDHFETPVFPWSLWSYIVPNVEPDAAWHLPGFDASSWNENIGGIGYGDDDDGTILPEPVLSVYSRITFNLSEPEFFNHLYLSADYDDGFVAYLNGVEVARVNMGEVGTDVPFDFAATAVVEPLSVQGLDYQVWEMDEATLQAALVDGENVLSIQVHNSGIGSSDLTGNFYLILVSGSSVVQTETAPVWLGLVVPPQPRLHTNFKLSVGETLILSLPDAAPAESVPLQAMQLGHVYQRSGDGNVAWCVSANPTPNAANDANCLSGYEQPPIFNVSSGAFDEEQIIALSAINPFADIRYTTDGSIPQITSALYTEPLQLVETTVLSARCFSNSSMPSAVAKNTYLIEEWAIDIPVISLSTDPYNLWDSLYGIHVYGPPDYGGYPYFGSNFWEDWERQAYMEYFDADHLLQVEGPVGIKIHGGWSRGNDQKSFRVQCKDEYGMETMDYPFIADKPWINSYKGFNLRNGGNEYWGYRFHDALMQRALKGTEADYMAYTPVVVFLNGEYWGFMEMREVLDQHWVEENHGLDNDDATVISYNYMGLNVINGSDIPFYPMFDYIMNNDPNSEGYYDFIENQIDLENYADYIIAETYWCNGDWSNGWINNTKFWHDDTEGGKWRFMLMDMDFGMGLAGNQPCDDYINTAQDEGYYTDQMFSRIIQNETFKNYFITRYADLMNTAFRPERVNDMGNEMRDEIESIFERHCQRWGTDFGSLQWSLDNRLNWNEQRNDCAFDMLQNHFGLQQQVNLTFDIEPAGAGRIHINTIEPGEEMYPWVGTYYNGVPVQITVVANPGFEFHHWAANGVFPVNAYLDQFVMNFETDESFVAHFEGSAVENAVVVSEFMYNDDANNESGDWIELHNTLDIPVDLTGMYMKDNNYFNRYDFEVNVTIPANGYLVFAEDTSLFATQYPDAAFVQQPLGYSLSNADDAVRLFGFHDEALIDIEYTDESPWPANSDGTGRTNEYEVQANNQSLAGNWFAGCIGGSPAAPYDPDCGADDVSEISEDQLSLYPIPASNVLYIKTEEALKQNTSMEITDAQGRLVFKQRCTQRITVLDVNDLPVGTYLLMLKSDAGIQTKALVIAR